LVQITFKTVLQEETVEQAVEMLKSKGVRQPVLMEVNGQFLVKVDDTAINAADCSCFTDAVEFLFMSFFVFNVEYPLQLRVFYGFLEKLVDIPCSIKSTTLVNFFRLLQN